jgi:hypothetical protein
MQWVPITALLLAVAWRPSANYQILLHFVVCAGASMVILALVFIRQNRVSTPPTSESLQAVSVQSRAAP